MIVMNFGDEILIKNGKDIKKEAFTWR